MEHNIDINEAVQMGANFLTSRVHLVGCWPERINLETLDMSSPTKDILGQLFENRYLAIVRLGLCQGPKTIRPEIIGLIPSVLFSATELTIIWKQLIPKIIAELQVLRTQ